MANGELKTKGIVKDILASGIITSYPIRFDQVLT
jgi:hypothetical protein